jgi:hypothetical protein
VILGIASINEYMLRPSLGRVLYRPREKKGGNRVTRAGLIISWLEMLEMLERERKYKQYKSNRLLDKPFILLR